MQTGVLIRHFSFATCFSPLITDTDGYGGLGFSPFR